MSEQQKALYELLRIRAKEAAKPGPKPKGGSIFSIIRDMDRLTTDIDMFNHTMTFVFQEKDRSAVEKLASKLPETWSITEKEDDNDDEKGKGEKYTYTVEVDRTLHDMGNGTFSLIVPETMEDVVLMHFPEVGIVESEVAHPVTPKYAKLLENLKKHFESGGKQIVFTEEKTQHNKILRIIVHHLPLAAGKIGIINGEVASGDKLDRISKAYNSGKLLIVIANKKAEVGVNLQKGTTAIHHLTLPWTPASINQRNGRGVRQGNKADSVAVYYYCGRGTFDSYRKDLLKAKSNWINDLLMGEAKTMENGDVTGLDELLDMLADNPEEAKRMRAERLAAQAAKREEAFRVTLLNKMQVLANLNQSINGIEERKASRRKTLEEQRDTAQRSIARYKVQAGDTSISEEERIKAKDKLSSAMRRLSEAEKDLSTLDQKFEKFRQKQENQKKMNESLLRQAAKDGKLPFDASLIDRPGDVVVAPDGAYFAVGELLEFKEDKSIRQITGVNLQERQITLKEIVGKGHSDRTISIHRLPEYIKVSYSPSELALKSIFTQEIIYAKIPSSVINKDMFLEHINEINIDWSRGAIVRIDGKIEIVEGAYPYRQPEGSVLVWPEPENEEFRKKVFMAYLERVRDRKSKYSSLLSTLFGDDFMEKALEYGNRGTDSEISEKCASLWKEYKENQELKTAIDVEKIVREQEYDIRSKVLDPILGMYDNHKDIHRIFEIFISALKEQARKDADEERQEMERLAAEELKSDPRYKEVPRDVLEKFSEIGIAVKVNLKETYLPGFKGRKGVTYEPFSRWFFRDEVSYGKLYNMKEMIKTRYDAKFTKDWSEHGGAWWHVSSATDLKEIYELLA